MMKAPHVVGPDPLVSGLSPAHYKVLDLLRKGSGYHVLGVWRFRGSRGRVKERTIISLLEKGLAERIETNQRLEVRITPVGRSANQKSQCCEVDPIRGSNRRRIIAACSANAALNDDVSSPLPSAGKS
jgi:hypothetical protein